MFNIVWLPSFETGIAEIDDDHRGLIKAIQKIDTALEASDLKACASLFRDFLNQAANHFKSEEVILKSIHFPRIESHCQAHKQLMTMGQEILNKVESGLDKEEAGKYLEEMVYFLLEDVIKADADFKSYAQEKGLI